MFTLVQNPRVVSNNSVNINFRQECARDKSLACKMIINLSLTYSCRINSFEDIERNVPVRIQKPRVVSNNSVNNNFSQKVLGTFSQLLLLSPINSFVDIERNVVRIQKPRVVSNNSVNINFS